MAGGGKRYGEMLFNICPRYNLTNIKDCIVENYMDQVKNRFAGTGYKIHREWGRRIEAAVICIQT